jgi:glycosyltransferase involved in cell wall biosynthesis
MLDEWSMRQSSIKKRLYLRLLGNRWLQGARKIHLTAQAELDQAAAWFPRSKGVVIPNLLDLGPFARLPGAEAAACQFPSLPGRARLLFLSRLHPKKGLPVFLRALQILKGRGIAVCGIVAGGGSTAYVDSVGRLAASLGLTSEDCRFTGPVVGPLKLSLYQSADLFVLPTSQENFGFVFIEALACGLPVVTTKGVDIWPELQASGAATIAGGDPDAVAAAVAATLTDGTDLRRLGALGREWAFRELDVTSIVERFAGMYRLAMP